MKYFFVTECISVSQKSAVFRVRIFTQDNTVGIGNLIVNSKGVVDAEYEVHENIPNSVQEEAKLRCIKRAKVIF